MNTSHLHTLHVYDPCNDTPHLLTLSLAAVLPIAGPLSYLLPSSHSGLSAAATPPHGPHLSVVQSSHRSRVGEEGSAVYAHERIPPW